MRPGATSVRIASPWRTALVAGVAALAVVAALATNARAAMKLPIERTSPTGNYFTLKAYVAPTARKPVANFEMKVCTSKHTPADTAIDPALFTLSLAHGGGTVAESIAVAAAPAMVLKPLKPLQCTEGWLGFRVPVGKVVSSLEYDYNGRISWAIG